MVWPLSLTLTPSQTLSLMVGPSLTARLAACRPGCCFRLRSLRSFLSIVSFFPSFLRRVRQAEPMLKTPTRQRPAAALDNPQLDLPLNLPMEQTPPSVMPSPAGPVIAAMPATLRGDTTPAAPSDTAETSSTPAPPLRAPDGT